VKIVCIFLLLLLSSGQCMNKNSTNNDTQALSYLALGDSYTIGESVDDSGRYPAILVKNLQQQGIPIGQPHIIARTGWTTDELLSAIKSQNPPNDYDLVSLLIGVNNQYRGYDIEIYKQEFELLLKIAIQKAKGNTSRVFVVSIPDYGVTPFAKNSDKQKIAKELDQYNEINKAIADQYQVQYFDITPISRQAINDPTLTAEDDLHPSAKMYAAWVALMVDDIAKMLGKK
jgi:acyl-CoA thioesterase I